MRALEAFLRDVYGARQIVADGVDARRGRSTRRPGWSRLGKLTPADAVRIAVAGIDLVRDRADHWLVLEDNLRVPSGIGYAITSRRLIRSVMPDLEAPAGVVGLEGVAGLLRGALLSATEPDAPGHDEVALLSAGPLDSAYYEHELLADRMGVPVVTPRDLQVTEDGVFLIEEGGRRRLSALYRRLDERALLTAKGADLRPIGRALCNAAARGRVAILNAMGNGVADDKVVYAYVPDMITYYLDEAPLLDERADLPVRRPRPARRGARPARRARAQAGRRLRRPGHRDRSRTPSREELAELAAAIRSRPGGLGGAGPRPALHPPDVHRATSWSRARWTCGRS